MPSKLGSEIHSTREQRLKARKNNLAVDNGWLNLKFYLTVTKKTSNFYNSPRIKINLKNTSPSFTPLLQKPLHGIRNGDEISRKITA